MNVFFEVFVNLFIICCIYNLFISYRFEEFKGIIKYKNIISNSAIFSFLITMCLLFMYIIIVGICYLFVTIL